MSKDVNRTVFGAHITSAKNLNQHDLHLLLADSSKKAKLYYILYTLIVLKESLGGSHLYIGGKHKGMRSKPEKLIIRQC
jgi:hypothetical protein